MDLPAKQRGTQLVSFGAMLASPLFSSHWARAAALGLSLLGAGAAHAEFKPGPEPQQGAVVISPASATTPATAAPTGNVQVVTAPAAPPPPAPAAPEGPEPWETDGTSVRMRIGAGFNTPTFGRGGSGFEQLRQVRVDEFGTGFEMMLDIEWEASRFFRVGGGLNYSHLWSVRDGYDRAGVTDIETALHFATLEGAVIPNAPLLRRGNQRLDLGLRLSGGLGYTEWRINDLAEQGIHYRAGVAAQLDYTARRAGFSFRFGYAHAWAPAMGPLDLEFRHQGLTGSFAFVERF